MKKQSAALFSIFSNSILIIFKVVAGLLMGSISVLSEAIHSGLDLMASVIAFVSIKESVKPKDAKHPFGHGKFENVSSFAQAMLILLAGGIIIVESIKKLTSGSEIIDINAGIAVMLISSITNLIISRILFKVAKKENSIALEADAMHLLTDVYTSFGVFLGLIIIKFTGIQILDPIIAILVSVMIVKVSIDLIKRSIDGLVDTSLSKDDIEKIKNLLDTHPNITSYHNLRTRKNGQIKEIDIHIHVDSNISIVDAHTISQNIEDLIKKEIVNSSTLVHIEPECHK